jgi:hypothetical protein
MTQPPAAAANRFNLREVTSRGPSSGPQSVDVLLRPKLQAICVRWESATLHVRDDLTIFNKYPRHFKWISLKFPAIDVQGWMSAIQNLLECPYFDKDFSG